MPFLEGESLRTAGTARANSQYGGGLLVAWRPLFRTPTYGGIVDGDIKPYWASLRCLPLCCWKTFREQRLYFFPLLIQQHVSN
jgi:hypothetical protein